VEASDILVGGHPRQVSANYYQGSPSALLPLGIPHITINGTLDDIVPIEYVRPFVETAHKLGDDATLIPATQPAGQLTIDTILEQFV